MLPLPEIDPPEAAQVTAVFELPVTVAVKLWLVPGAIVAGFGETEMETPTAAAVKFTPVVLAAFTVTF